MGNVLSHRLRLRAAAALAILCALGPAAASDGLYVVVSAENPLRTLERSDLVAIYTGRTRAFPNGETARPLDQKRNGAARAEFYRALTGMDLARINSYWARLHFTGQVQPPQTVEDDAAVMRRVRDDPSAIGYLTRAPQDSALRVVLRLP
ncbi:MAG: hypothetical protein PGN26_07890 [Xylophilus ampelinus]